MIEQCPMCGTENTYYMGNLGGLHYYRCRDCHAEFSGDDPEELE